MVQMSSIFIFLRVKEILIQVIMQANEDELSDFKHTYRLLCF